MPPTELRGRIPLFRHLWHFSSLQLRTLLSRGRLGILVFARHNRHGEGALLTPEEDGDGGEDDGDEGNAQPEPNVLGEGVFVAAVQQERGRHVELWWFLAQVVSWAGKSSVCEWHSRILAATVAGDRFVVMKRALEDFTRRGVVPTTARCGGTRLSGWPHGFGEVDSSSK